MADSTIANLPTGSPAQSSDQLPIQRGSSTLKILVSDILALVTAGVSSVFGRTGAVTAQTGDYSQSQISSGAIANGSTATTQAALSNDTKVATDAYVDSAVSASASSLSPTGHLNGLIPALGLTIGLVVEPTIISASDGGTLNYTVPTGKRAIVDLWAFTVKGAAGESIWAEVNISGTWYQIGTATPITANSAPAQIVGAAPFNNNCLILEAGDIFDVKGATGGITAVQGTIYVFPNTVGYKTPRLVGTIPLGDNTLYTCPGGKSASTVIGRPSDTSAAILITNPVSGVMVRGISRLASGASSAGASTQRQVLAATINVAQFITQTTNVNMSLAAGDSIDFRLLGGGNNNPFNITSVAAASGGSTVYTGAFANGAANAFAGCSFYVEGLFNAVNNGLFVCTASTATTLTLTNAVGVAETKGAQAVFAAYALTAVANASGGNTVYTCAALVDQSANTLTGWTVTISGLASNNNGTFVVVSNTSGAITVNNPNGTLQTAAGTLTLTSLPGMILWLAGIYER